MNRQTSGILFSYVNKSAYHESCVPKPPPQAPVPAATGGSPKDADFNKCDNVTQDAIWKQSVHSERRCMKNWEENWGFIADYDSKGELKEKEELPEKANMFSDAVPNTNAGNYGSQLTSEPGQAMQKLQFQFYSDTRRRKLPSDMICY